MAPLLGEEHGVDLFIVGVDRPQGLWMVGLQPFEECQSKHSVAGLGRVKSIALLNQISHTVPTFGIVLEETVPIHWKVDKLEVLEGLLRLDSRQLLRKLLGSLSTTRTSSSITIQP